MWIAFFLALGASAPSGAVPRYDRYELFELALCAERVVVGEIQRVGSSTFVLRVEERLVGEGIPATVEVRRFEDWTCASRWTGYRSGQRVLLFLGTPEAGSRVLSILGGGGEGEMPLVGSDVIVRGYDVHGYERRVHEVKDGEAEGTLVSAGEFASAVCGFRAAYRWEMKEWNRLRSIEPREAELAQVFEASSRLARHFVEQARSSPAWAGPVEDEGRLIPSEGLRRISAQSLGCTGTARSTRVPDRFGFELWSGFGDALAFLGDVDGDGVGELVVGAPSDSRAGHYFGALWILFLERDGSVRSKTEISEHTGGFRAELNEFAALGSSVAPLGDLNADGVPDLAVGAKGWRKSGKRRGGVWIAFLARDGTIASSVELGSSPALLSAGAGEGAGIGASLAALGDLDGDGLPELALAQDPEFDLGWKHGRSVWIVSLDSQGGMRWARRIHDRHDGFTTRSSWFGDALSRVGDLDGDGTTELAIADTYDADGGEVRGAVWIAFLSANGSLKHKQKISDWSGGFAAPMRDWERFGQALAGPGDLDGDEIPDLLVGSRSGLWTLRLARDGTVRAHELLRSPTGALGQDWPFARSMAWEGSRASGSRLVVSGAFGEPQSVERDALVWFFSSGEDGQLSAW